MNLLSCQQEILPGSAELLLEELMKSQQQLSSIQIQTKENSLLVRNRRKVAFVSLVMTLVNDRKLNPITISFCIILENETSESNLNAILSKLESLKNKLELLKESIEVEYPEKIIFLNSSQLQILSILLTLIMMASLQKIHVILHKQFNIY